MSVAAAADQQDPGREFVDFWNEILVPKFIRYKHILVDGLTHHSEAIFPTLPVNKGDSVLDVGCGFGDTAMKLARIVGESGRVVGIDCCDAFMDYGRREVAAAGLGNVSFVNGDALTEPFAPDYDFVFSRFGTMFFANPVMGLRNMRYRASIIHGSFDVRLGEHSGTVVSCQFSTNRTSQPEEHLST